MANLSKTTQDHEEIQRWAEERGAHPACVKGTGGEGDTGMIRLDFPGYSGEESLQHITWEEWFDKFDERNLALLFQEETAGGERSNFNKLVSAETAEAAESGRHRKRGSTSRSSRGGSKSASSRGSAGSSSKRSNSSAKKSASESGGKNTAPKSSAKKGASSKKSAAAANKKGAASKKGAVKKQAGAAKKAGAKKASPAKKGSAKKSSAKGASDSRSAKRPAKRRR